jgi:hypothetical protein
MSAVKKIGVVVTVGAVIAVAYYFLNKSKPKIAEEQLADLGKDTETPIEEQLASVPTIEEQLQLDKCAGLPRSEYERCMGITPAGTGTRGNTTTGTRGNTTSTSASTTQTPTAGTTTTGATTVQTPTGGTTTSGTNTSGTTTNTPTRGTSTTIRSYSGGRRG